MFEPIYLSTHRRGDLAAKAHLAGRLLGRCRLCPRECLVDRTAGRTGFCRAGAKARVASFSPHFGEEAPLVGRAGSGTIFFSRCNLGCRFCQNEDISLAGAGRDVTDDGLAGMMLHLQAIGCHNINLVTPTPHLASILAALVRAVEAGLTAPLVYNCGGYESLEALELLDGVVDIYMPDFKFTDPKQAEELCSAPDYPDRARAALTEMHRQVGDLVIDDDGLTRRGLLVRHLVLPENRAGTESAAAFLAGLSPRTYVNIMPQYRPCAEAGTIPGMDRRPTAAEFREAVEAARRAGLSRFDQPRLKMWGLG